MDRLFLFITLLLLYFGANESQQEQKKMHETYIVMYNMYMARWRAKQDEMYEAAYISSLFSSQRVK